MKGERLKVKGSAHAGGYSEGGGDGGKYGDDDVEYLAPSVFVFHDVCVFFDFLPQRTRSLTEFLFYHPHGKLKRTP